MSTADICLPLNSCIFYPLSWGTILYFLYSIPAANWGWGTTNKYLCLCASLLQLKWEMIRRKWDWLSASSEPSPLASINRTSLLAANGRNMLFFQWESVPIFIIWPDLSSQFLKQRDRDKLTDIRTVWDKQVQRLPCFTTLGHMSVIMSI